MAARGFFFAAGFFAAATSFMSATAGLGSSTGGEPADVETVTGTVSVWYFVSAKLTVKLSAVATVTEQGVLQLGPTEVVAVAPGGVDSSCSVASAGLDLKRSHEEVLDVEEHPASVMPAATITKTRMIYPSF